MTRVTYTDLFNFDNQWSIKEGQHTITKTKHYVIICGHRLILRTSQWHMTTDIQGICQYCGPIPDKVLTAYKLLI